MEVKQEQKSLACEVKKTRLIPVCILLAVLVVILIGTTVYFLYQNQLLQKQNSLILDKLTKQNQPSPTLFIESTPSLNPQISQNPQVSTKSSTLYIKRELTKHDDNGNIVPGAPYVNIIIDFPKEILVSKNDDYRQLVKTGTTTYSVAADSIPAGLCAMEDDGSGCGYTQEKLSGDSFLRIWKDNKGIFALNFQSLSIKGYFIDHFEIFKDKPTKTFSDNDIIWWKDWVKQLKVVPSEM